jgi:hypothetical protein
MSRPTVSASSIGPHGHAEGDQRGVDGFGRDALVDAAHGLVHVGAEHGIDQEARRVSSPAAAACRSAHEGGRRGATSGRWPRPDHFDQRHHRHRVEEVDADQARGSLSTLAMSASLQAGGVGGEHASGLARASMSANSARLASRFSKMASMITSAWRHAVAGDRDQAVERKARLPGRAASSRSAWPRGRWPARCAPRTGPAASRSCRAGAPGGDVAAHDAGADHMHALRREVRILAEALQALLQEEDAHQVARRRERPARRARSDVGRHRQRLPP